jgi:hypothetical protein
MRLKRAGGQIFNLYNSRDLRVRAVRIGKGVGEGGTFANCQHSEGLGIKAAAGSC